LPSSCPAANVPAVYVWNVRRRLIYWYRQLNALEKSLDGGAAKYAPVTAQAEIERSMPECGEFACRILLGPTVRSARPYRPSPSAARKTSEMPAG